MSALIVCNTGSDSINKISIEQIFDKGNILNQEMFLNIGEKPLGPSGICLKKDILYTTNNYSNSISIININILKEESNIYVGAHPNDLVNYNDYLYISCSESNTVVLYDLKLKRNILDIPVNNLPKDIEISEELGLVFVSNLQSNNISIIDIKENKVINHIKSLEYPTKVKVSNNGAYIYVCESYMGDDKDGYIKIYSLESFQPLGKIKVGRVPIDITEDEKNIYVCNFGDGTIDIINKSNFKIVSKINLGGMPREIKKYKEIILVADYLRGRIVCMDLNENKTKIITVGKEPNAMILC